MGRIGSFDPGSQGPVEPSSSISRCREQIQDDIDDFEIEIARRQDTVDQIKKKIKQMEMQIEHEENSIKQYTGRLDEYNDWIKDLDEEEAEILSAKESINIEIEMLQEEEEPDRSLLAILENKRRDIINRL